MPVNRPAALVAYRAISDVVGRGAFFLVTVVAARRLAANAFGVFSLGSTIGWMVAVAADFGVQFHVARAVSRDPVNAGPILRAWLRLRLWMTGATLGCVVLVAAATGAAGAHTSALVLLALVYGVNGLTEFLHYYYRGLSRSDLESTITLGQRGATMAIAIAALWWRPDVTVLAVALLVPALGTFAYSARLASRLAGVTRSDSGLQTIGAEFRRDVMPIGLGIVLSALYFRIDVFLVEAWKGAAAVGLYNAVFRLVEALRLFPAAALAVALPSLCRATSARLLVTVSAGVTGFAVVVTAVLWAAAGWIVSLLYGPRYLDAVPAFRILLLAFPLMSLNYALTHQLIGWNGHRAYALICAIALVFNVALNMRLIPALSIVGAAWSTLLTEVALTAGCLVALSMGGLGAAGAPLAIAADM